MIRCDLHQGDHGLDNLALWYFALDHVAWMYNKLSQMLNGLTRLDMIMSYMADHKDLACTHVWGLS